MPIPSFRISIVVFGLILWGTPFAQPQEDLAPPPRYRSDTVLLKPNPAVTPPQMATQHAGLHARCEHRFPALGSLEIVKLPPGVSVEKALERYQRSGLVEYAEPDYEVHTQLSPNDPFYTSGSLWNLNNYGQVGTA